MNMQFHRSGSALAWMVVTGACTAAAAGPAGAAPAALDTIYVAIVPTDTIVTPGGTFDVHFVVTQAGLGFNAYDAVIAYDPAALTLLPQASSWQQGSLMVGACGNTFHRFQAAGDSVVVNHSLLCAGVSLQGPGTLYNLRFAASAGSQTTHVVLRSIRFYDDGMDRGPVKVQLNTVHVGPPTDVTAPPGAAGFRVQVAPNPFNPRARIHVEFPAPGAQSLAVYDGRGRLVRVLTAGVGPAGRRDFEWDGRDGAGGPAAAGVYFMRARAGGMAATVRAVLAK